MNETWYDGVCNTCGCSVEETSIRHVTSITNDPKWEKINTSDYMNRCTNVNCEHHVWHYVGDQEFANYYEHK